MLGVLAQLGAGGTIRVLALILVLVALAIASVAIGNRYGSLWGGLVGIVVCPLVFVQIIRRMPTKSSRGK
jgi:hypothetical protein